MHDFSLILDAVLQILGALGLLATVLGATLPRSWRVTALLVRWGADLRKIRSTPAEHAARSIAEDAEDDPDKTPPGGLPKP